MTIASRPVVVTALGIAQILGWGTSFYFPAVLAAPIVAADVWLRRQAVSALIVLHFTAILTVVLGASPGLFFEMAKRG